jgi:hypothetical protein
MAGDANLKLIKGVTLNWVSGRYEEILPYVADDAVYEIAPGSLEKFSPLFGTFRGKKAIAGWYETNRQIPLRGGFHPFCKIGNLGEFISAGNQVISYGRMPKTRTEPASDWVAIWTLKREKIVHCWLVMDTASTFLKFKKFNPKAVLK